MSLEELLKKTAFTPATLVNFTRSERNNKNYTVGQAVESARRQLKGKSLNLTCIHGIDLNEKVTLVERNQITNHIVNESIYWG